MTWNLRATLSPREAVTRRQIELSPGAPMTTDGNLVLVDHLDSWSLVAFVRHCRRGTRIMYLTRAKWLDWGPSKFLLSWLGFSAERLTSPFEDPGTPEGFVAFNETLAELAG